MASNNKINLSVPSSTAIADSNGNLKQEWRLWFNKLYQRLGGDSASSNADLETIINNLTNEINNLEESINDFSSRFSNVNSRISSINNSISSINSSLLELTQLVNDNSNDSLNFQNSITSINEQLINISTSLASLITQVNTNTSDISTLKSNVDQINSRIDSISDQIGEIIIQLNSNTAAIQSIQTQQGANNTAIANLVNSVIKTITSIGTGISIWSSTSDNNANFKSLKAGTNITLDNTTDPNTIIINSSGGSGGGINEGSGTGGVNSSTIYSKNGLQVNTTGSKNSGLGYNTLLANITGSSNTAIGNGALKSMNDGSQNTAIGVDALGNNDHGVNNIGIGYQALLNSTYGGGSSLAVSNNVGIGAAALLYCKGSSNVAIGNNAMNGDSTSNGSNNTAIGSNTLFKNTTGGSNTALGTSALYNNTSGGSNFGLGNSALFANTTGFYNVAIGPVALRENTTGTGNIGIGLSSYRYSNANYQTGVGYLSGTNTIWDNTTCIGANTDCTAPNQVQLGSSATTTYVYGTVQNRSDERDKADIKESNLGLEFIMQLKPKQWKWDFREDYKVKHVDEDGNVIIQELPKDGSKKRKRYHNGFIAQDILNTMISNSIDFGGFQDHNITEGQDVLSLGYDEFIGPLVKAVQQQQAMIEKLQEDIAALKSKNGV